MILTVLFRQSKKDKLVEEDGKKKTERVRKNDLRSKMRKKKSQNNTFLVAKLLSVPIGESGAMV